MQFCVLFLEEKSSGFRLKPPILIHGQAPSAGEFGVFCSNTKKPVQAFYLLRSFLKLLLHLEGGSTCVHAGKNPCMLQRGYAHIQFLAWVSCAFLTCISQLSLLNVL